MPPATGRCARSWISSGSRIVEGGLQTALTPVGLKTDRYVGDSLPVVARRRLEPRVLDRLADAEVVQALPRVPGQAERLVHRVVVEAADAGAAHPGGLGLEIEHLPDQPALPEQPPVHPVAVRGQQRLEARQHAEAEEAVAGDVLIARQPVGHPRHIGRQQQKQVRRRAAPAPTGTRDAWRRAGRSSAAGSRRKRVDARHEPLDAVHEQHQVHGRRPVESRPTAAPCGRTRVSIERNASSGSVASRVEAHGAATPQDDLARAAASRGLGPEPAAARRRPSGGRRLATSRPGYAAARATTSMAGQST